MRWWLVLALLGGCGDDSQGSRQDAAPGRDGPTGDDAGGGGCAGCGSIRFLGQGDSYGDRVRFRLDDPTTTTAGPALDVGAADFTIELWLRGSATDNANTIDCNSGTGWTSSNIVVDRDRHNQLPTFGVGIQAGALVWAVNTSSGGLSACGDAIVADGSWHHIAVDRRRSDGRLRIWVDGALDLSVDGPDGDVSYPDDGQPLNVCPLGSCSYSDPYLVLGAEKHGYPGISFTGNVDELRVSTTLRYDAPFTPAMAPFSPDAQTVGLYHLDETSGTIAADASASDLDGEVVLGGSPQGPTWSTDSPF